MKKAFCILVSAFCTMWGVSQDMSVHRHRQSTVARLLRLGKELMEIKGIEVKNRDLAEVKCWRLPEEVAVNGRPCHVRSEALPIVRGHEYFATNQPMRFLLCERLRSNERHAVGTLYLARSVELAYRMALGEEARQVCFDMPHFAKSFRVEFRGEVMVVSGLMRHRARNPQFTDQVTAVYRNLVCTVDTAKDGAEIALALVKACCPGCDAGPESGPGRGEAP